MIINIIQKIVPVSAEKNKQFLRKKSYQDNNPFFTQKYRALTPVGYCYSITVTHDSNEIKIF